MLEQPGELRPVTGAERPSPRTTYRPIGDYALIGDTLTSALVASDGTLDWLCLPDHDSPAMFAGLLDVTRGGEWRIGPGEPAETERSYTGAAPVLVTRHRCDGGTFTVTDFLPILHGQRGLWPLRQVIRLIEVKEGAPQVNIRFAPRPGYGASVPVFRRIGRFGFETRNGAEHLQIGSQIPLEEVEEGTLAAQVRLAQGEKRAMVLSFTRGGPAVLVDPAEGWDRLTPTLGWWDEQVKDLRLPEPFEVSAQRSFVTLRLMQFGHSGAVIAAPTLGLPEVIGGVRNYDYRFCWLRDASFILNAFGELGDTEAAADFFRWLMEATRTTAPRLGTFYSVFGRTDMGQQSLRLLEGWRRSAPLSIGNGAQSQLQLDAYGSIIGAARMLVRAGGELARDEVRRLVAYAEETMKVWSKPDNGLWEMPDPRRHHVYSKAMCWYALDSAIWLADQGVIATDTARFRRAREQVRETFLVRGWHEGKGCFTGAFGEEWLDAALLLLPRLGIVEADDPRMVATWEAIRDELGCGDSQIRRYNLGVDGLPGDEGSFTVCGFWAVDYLARAGRIEEAEARMQVLLGHANDLGLMSEELDPESGAQLGNFPQGFSHAGIISAAIALRDAKEARK